MTKGLFYASFGIMLITIGIVLSISAYAASPDDYKPNWYQSWEGTRSGVLGSFWDQINFWNIDEGYDLKQSADYLGWYKGTTFDVQNWEREVCLMDLSSDVRNIRSSSKESSSKIYTTTVSVSAKKSLSYGTSYLYEVSYYIRPYDSAATYKVYLFNTANSQEKYYLAGTKSTTKNVAAGKSQGGYEAKYIDAVYDKVVIEFTENGFLQNMEASIS